MQPRVLRITLSHKSLIFWRQRGFEELYPTNPADCGTKVVSRMQKFKSARHLKFTPLFSLWSITTAYSQYLYQKQPSLYNDKQKSLLW